MSLVYILFLTIHEWIVKKNINISNIIMVLCSLSGFLILMLAPGSGARLGVTKEFYALSLIEKLKLNIPNIIFTLFGQYTKIITIIFLIIAIYLTYKNIKGVNKNKWLGLINKVSIISSSVILFVTAIRSDGYFDFIYYLRDSNAFKIFALIIIFMQLLLILYSFVYYFYNIKDYKYIYLIFGACVSQAGMAIAPYYPLRSSIMFDIVIFLLLVYSLKDIYGINKGLFKYLIIILGIISIFNFSNITYGYYTNMDANKVNDEVL